MRPRSEPRGPFTARLPGSRLGAPVVRSSCPPLPPGADHRGRTGRLLTAAAPQLSGWEGRARVSGACRGHGDSGAVVSGGREGGPYTLGRSQAVGDLRVWSRWVGPSHLHSTLRVPRGRSHENRRATSDPRKMAWNVPEPLKWTSDLQSPGKGLPLQNHKHLSAPQRKHRSSKGNPRTQSPFLWLGRYHTGALTPSRPLHLRPPVGAGS